MQINNLHTPGLGTWPKALGFVGMFSAMSFAWILKKNIKKGLTPILLYSKVAMSVNYNNQIKSQNEETQN